MLRARLWLFNENLMVSGTIIISFTLTICVDSVNGTYICVCVCVRWAISDSIFFCLYLLFVVALINTPHRNTLN